MGMKSNFSLEGIQAQHEIIVNNIVAVIEDALSLAATQLVTYAKELNTYTDRTNNLRSSIGFVLYKDGQKIGASFAKSGVGVEGDGAQGTEKGENYAVDVAGKYQEGYVLVLAAGMHYAAYVEAKGYDVLTGASLKMDDEITKYFELASGAVSEALNIDLNFVKK